MADDLWMQSHPGYISLGSNQGDPEANLQRARIALANLPEVRLGPCSPIYKTEPQNIRDQPWFANQILRLDCGPAWTAVELLETMLEIEKQMGRVRKKDKGPRIIDLDLLLFGDQRHNSPVLTLPHPRIMERAFILVPLQDIAPTLTFPNGTPIQAALNAITFQVRGNLIYQSSND
ncbi:2-amino-4-hydroxy-6-hydroxymethyldihydropteridine diphosphokinase [Desulfonatronum thiosulfatophilum]|nr:2-amino-4-hydroxy-6-hydroxymethyldihydropteridine diphosphokinase [Desulfonatronum thiosulfatophilum]